MRTRLLCAALLMIGLLSACASRFDPATAYQNLSMTQIFDNGEQSLRTGYYKDAIQYFQTLDARYPYGHDTEIAQLHIIYAYYMNSDNINAMAAAERFIHLHPASAHVDYAYYMRALTHYEANIGDLARYMPIDFASRDLSDAKQSFLDFSTLTHRFPHSIYVADAKLHMVYLRNLIALHEIEVARFYLSRKAYVAAANRANIVVRHFQGTPYVPDALAIMMEAYRQLGETDLVEETKRVYDFNHYHAKVV